MKPKIGEYYTINNQEIYGIVKIVEIYNRGDSVLLEYTSNKNSVGYIGKDMKDYLLNGHPELNIREGKDYEGFSTLYYDYELAYKKIKDTKLARKMYTEIVKEKDGYIYVKY